jgi:hypothetical protein
MEPTLGLLADRAVDTRSAEVLLGQQFVVRGAQQAGVLRRRLSSESPGVLVVKLQEARTRATFALWRNVAALKTIALNDDPADGVGDAPSIRLGRVLLSRALRLCESLAFELVDQDVEGPLHDDRQISARVGVAQEISGKAEFPFQLSAGVELKAVAILA